jgi:hypothetical protein
MPFISKVGSRTGNRCKKPVTSNANIVLTNGLTNMDTTGMTLLSSISNLTVPINGTDDGFAYIPFSMDFKFFGTTYNSANGAIPASSVYWCTNNVLGFGVGKNDIYWSGTTGNGFIVGGGLTQGIADRRTNNCYVSYSSSSGISILKLVTGFQNSYSDNIPYAGRYQIRLIRDTNATAGKQYLELRCNNAVTTGGKWSVINGTTFNPDAYITNIATGNSFVLVNNNLNGDSWTYVANSYVNV